MKGLRVECEKDRVILVFPSRGQDLCLPPDSARQLVAAMRKAAGDCDVWIKAGGGSVLIRGESRGARVMSWDGKVNVRFDSITDRESIPFEAARILADHIEAKIVEAENRITLLFQPAESIT